jgi:hypothetical protein
LEKPPVTEKTFSNGTTWFLVMEPHLATEARLVQWSLLLCPRIGIPGYPILSISDTRSKKTNGVNLNLKSEKLYKSINSLYLLTVIPTYNKRHKSKDQRVKTNSYLSNYGILVTVIYL